MRHPVPLHEPLSAASEDGHYRFSMGLLGACRAGARNARSQVQSQLSHHHIVTTPCACLSTHAATLKQLAGTPHWGSEACAHNMHASVAGVARSTDASCLRSALEVLAIAIGLGACWKCVSVRPRVWVRCVHGAYVWVRLRVQMCTADTAVEDVTVVRCGGRPRSRAMSHVCRECELSCDL